jgi:chromosome segregation ATPase
MCRKIGFGLIATVLTLGALWVVGAVTLGAGKTNSLVSCTFSKWQKDANDQLPVEVEIQRLQHEVNQIVPDMKNNIVAIGQETVAVRSLKKEVETIEANLGKQKADMLAASEQIERNERYVVYKDREYTTSQAKDKLARELEIYKRNRAELQAKKDLLDARERSLESAKEQLAAMKDQKRELEIQLARLEAKHKALQVAQTRSKFQFNDTRMTEIKKSLAELDARLDVEAETLSLHEEFAGEGRPIQKNRTSQNITQEVREYFNEGGSDNGKAVAETTSKK